MTQKNTQIVFAMSQMKKNGLNSLHLNNLWTEELPIDTK